MTRVSAAVVLAVVAACGTESTGPSESSTEGLTLAAISPLELVGGTPMVVVLTALGAEGTVVFELRDAPAFAAIQGNQLHLTPARLTDAGDYTITVNATDEAYRAQVTISLRVARDSRAPILFSGAYITRPGEGYVAGDCAFLNDNPFHMDDRMWADEMDPQHDYYPDQPCELPYLLVTTVDAIEESDPVRVEVEVWQAPESGEFLGHPFTATHTSPLADYPIAVTEQPGTRDICVHLGGLQSGVAYQFAYRAVEPGGLASAWQWGCSRWVAP